ncbi:MAG: chromosome segregation protein SMC [Nitrospirota bacterium]
MRLTRLEITGFKSFGDRTVLTFQPGITAIVGPNGCGKSNIADAILWCLGEQSPKTLRGDRMEDVLFNGSSRRAATGLAEVSLTLGGVRPGEIEGVAGSYSEVTITRRLYRSGESEYLINRIPSRLKDIKDLLIESGAGIKGHTILEQGKVGEIVTASPIERRALVEETAGITKYKIRKAEALRKLESTEQNLLRVRDIISEVKRQLASLDRQVRKAERYRQTAEHLRALELRAAVTRYREWSSQTETLTAELDRARADSAGAMAQLSALDAATESLKTDVAELEGRLHEARSELTSRETAARDAHHRIDVLAAQAEEWRTQQTTLAAELDEIARSLAARAAEQARLTDQAAALDAAIEERTGLVADRETAVRTLEQQLAQVAADIERTRHRVFEAASAVTTATNALTSLAARGEDLDRRRARYRDDIATVQTEIANKRVTHHEFETSHQLHAQSLATRDAERTALREVSASRQAALQEGEAVLTGRRDELMRLRATLDSLRALQRDLVGYDEGVRRVLLADPSGAPASGLLGVVADILDIPVEYERAVEAVLTDRLQGVVSENQEHIAAALALLDHQQAGRAVFVPKTPRTVVPTADVTGTFPTSDGVCGPAARFVGCRPGFEELRDALFATVVIVEDRATARRSWETDERGLTWVSRSGDVFYPSGMVSGGTGSNAGLNLLERKRQIKTIELETLNAETAIAPLEASVASLREALDADRSALEALDAEVREAELRLLHDRKAAEAVAQELVQLDRRLALLTTEDSAVVTELEGMTREIEHHETARSAAETAKLRDEAGLVQQYETAAHLKTLLAQEQSAANDLRLALAADREKREHASATLRAIADRMEEAHRLVAAKDASRAQFDGRIVAATEERVRLVAEIASLDRHVETLRERVEDVAKTRADASHRVRETEDQSKTARRQADAAQERVHTLTVSLTETKLRADQQVTDIRDRYQTDLATLSEDALPQASCEPDQLEATITELKETLSQIGGVNLAAIDEYRELEERSGFLAAQENDLVQSVDNLRAAIAKINATTKTLFLEAFEALNARFGEVFASFFEGGQAALHLVDEGNPLESGIEIVAQPPGKKLRHISLLSGGEKTLTAISLLFSSFLIHPSPFCVMDEIDAPLDEENVRRFTRALRPMTAHSQFLVVTHNRRTMEQADVLYGVTMEEAGMSKIVSVKLQRDREDSSAVEVDLATAELSI